MLTNLKLGIHYRNASYRGGFGDALEEMDSSIGKLMDHIKTSGIENNTMIIFTSDNGQEHSCTILSLSVNSIKIYFIIIRF